MTNEQRAGFRSLEGQKVCLALADGTRLDDCELVSAGRHRTSTLWLFADGADTFVAIDDVIDLWEPRPASHHRTLRHILPIPATDGTRPIRRG